jgi:hypothetical protein
MQRPELRARIAFGAPDRVALCVLADEGISEERARELIDDAWREETSLYGLRVEVASVTAWRRPAFAADGIIQGLLREPLGPGCDRIFALVNRHAGDVVWGLLLPEVLGAVNDETLTHGYAVVGRASLNQVFMPPVEVVRHELHHMVGCDAHFDMERCYRQIAMLKHRRQDHDADFFPAWDRINQRMLVSREAVRLRLEPLTNVSAAGSTR